MRECMDFTNLMVDPSALKNVGGQVSNKGEEFTKLLGQIQQTNTELQSYWEGAEATKYAGAVEQQLALMNELATTINEIGSFLTNVGTKYEQVSAENAGAIRG